MSAYRITQKNTDAQCEERQRRVGQVYVLLINRAQKKEAATKGAPSAKDQPRL